MNNRYEPVFVLRNPGRSSFQPDDGGGGGGSAADDPAQTADQQSVCDIPDSSIVTP
jgi:hypothetical protein